ncbi:MAG: glycosyltransferase involved in cell wall biosynthesis [Arenicella sp.]|jgi:glycosyltransferase involved in cell wall biosynthesis
MIKPQVSVLMLVYEHQDFVAQAIENVLNQQCDFQFELLIIDDFSTDRSAEICHYFAGRYPQTIRFIGNLSNIGMHDSFEKIWNASAANLVAFCEGDDFWIDRAKLQQQVDLMRQNPHWNLCGAKAQVIELSSDNEWLITNHIQPVTVQQEYSFEDLINAYRFHFSTVMLRKQSVVFPDWFKRVYCVDRPIYLLAVENGKAGYLDSVVSSYRIHSGGNWSSISSLRKAAQSTDLFLKLAANFDSKYTERFETTLFNILLTYVAIEMTAKRFDNARQIFRLGFSKLNFMNKLRYFIKYFRTVILLLLKR